MAPQRIGLIVASIVIVDTYILTNVLDVPGFNQQRAEVLTELRGELNSDALLFLPFAAIIETGNHIAQLPDGRVRRQTAQTFVTQVEQAIRGDAPWQTLNFPTIEVTTVWLGEFPDAATRQIGMGDLSILKEWERLCDRHPGYRVRIWSLDGGLTGYDRPAHT